jgi:hypothetical protein
MEGGNGRGLDRKRRRLWLHEKMSSSCRAHFLENPPDPSTSLGQTALEKPIFRLAALRMTELD